MTDWDKRVSDAAEQHAINSDQEISFIAGAKFAREEFAKQYRELLDENIQLGHELIDLRQQCEAMANALKAVDVWFERLKADHDAKLGESFEAACENWDDLLQKPLDLTPVKDALAQYKKFKEEK